MENTTKIEISLKSVLLIILTLILLLLAWKIRGILMGIFIAFILMSGFAPLVDWLVKKGFNKTVSVVITYFLLISFFVGILFFVIPPLIAQTREFLTNLPIYVSWVTGTFGNTSIPGVYIDSIIGILLSKLDSALSNILTVALNAFSLFVTFITVAVFSFYLLLERESIKRNIHIFFPHLPKQRVYSLSYKIEEKLGAWVRGQALLMVIIGVTTYIGLTILGVEFALPLAVIAGLLEIVPIIGPIVSVIPAVLVAFIQSPILAVGVVALYLLIQQLENTIIVPKLMEKAVGLSPLLIIFALLVGGSLFGLLGAIIAVPAAAIGHVIFEDFRTTSK